MKNKEKQIRKMAKIYCHIHNKFFNYNCFVKSPCAMKKLCKEFNIAYARGSEETAERIYNKAKEVVEKTKYIVDGKPYLHIDVLKSIIEQLGVEIKE